MVSVVKCAVKFYKSSVSWRLVDWRSRAIAVDIDTTIYHRYDAISDNQISIVMAISDKNHYFQVYLDAAQSFEMRRFHYFSWIDIWSVKHWLLYLKCYCYKYCFIQSGDESGIQEDHFWGNQCDLWKVKPVKIICDEIVKKTFSCFANSDPLQPSSANRFNFLPRFQMARKSN